MSADEPTPPGSGGGEGEGQRLGPYRLVRLIGEGGMARIFLAEHEKLGRMVAIKRLHRTHFDDKIIVARFLAEARAVADIAHPNLIAVHDVVEEPDEIYLVMDYYDGRDVADVLREGGKLSPERAIEIAAGVCDGLQAVHERGIIHRDLKPENVFLAWEPDGKQTVKLLDFGVARLTEDRPKELRTRSGLTVGTPTYMSPEQATASKIDPRSDLYAVGVLLYEMIAGKPPFTGGYGDVMLKHVNDSPAPLSSERPDVPPWLEAIVMRCLAKSPGDRFQTAAELATALRAGEHGQIATIPVPVSRGRPSRYLGAVLLGAAGILALSLLGLKLRPQDPDAAPVEMHPTSGAMGAPRSLRAASSQPVGPATAPQPPRVPSTTPLPSNPQSAAPVRAEPVKATPQLAHALRVVTNPPGARVSLNRELRCQSPCEIPLLAAAAPGATVEVGVAADGYLDDQRTVDPDSPPPEIRFTLRRRADPGQKRNRTPSDRDKDKTVNPFQ